MIAKLEQWQVAISQTDTVWGIVAKMSEANYERIYDIKQRDLSKPLILFVDSVERAKNYSAYWDDEIQTLADKYWPGALTIILPKADTLPVWLNPEFDSVAFRIPANESVMSLMPKDGVLLSTSANFSGEDPVANYAEAAEAFSEHADLVLKPLSVGLATNVASTIVKFDADGSKTIVRQGEIQL